MQRDEVPYQHCTFVCSDSDVKGAGSLCMHKWASMYVISPSLKAWKSSEHGALRLDCRSFLR